MKKIEILVVIFIIGLVNLCAQGEGEYYVKMHAKVRGKHHHNKCENFFQITANTSSNSQIWSWYEGISRPQNEEKNFYKSLRYSASKQISKLNLKSRRQHKSWGSCSTDDKGDDDFNFQVNQQVATKKIPIKGWTYDINIEIYPYDIRIVSSNPTSPKDKNIFSTDDNIILSASSDFHQSVYEWEYTLESGIYESDWKLLPNKFQGISSISISGRDLFGDKAVETMLPHKNIKFRIKCKTELQHTPISLDIMLSAPHIVGMPDFTAPSCNGYTDGMIQIDLDRDLVDDEELRCYYGNDRSIKLRKGDLVRNQSKNVYTFSIENIGVIDGQAAKISFLGFYKGQDSNVFIGGKDHVRTVPTNQPASLNFSFTQDDVQCYGYHQGAVKLNVTGGNIKDKQYFLHWAKGDEAYSGDSIPFAKGDNDFIMDRLEAEKYRFFVTDYKGCFSKTKDTPTKEKSEQEVTITQPKLPVTIVVKDSISPSGYGLNNGRVSVSVTHGFYENDVNKTYEVLWTKNGDEVLRENVPEGGRSSLSKAYAGTYKLNIRTNSTGCDTTFYYTLSQPDSLIVDITQTAAILCNGNTNATLLAKVKGGVLDENKGYRYAWHKMDGNDKLLESGLSETATLANVGVGKYQVKVTDNSNPANTTVQTILVSQPDSVTFSVDAPVHVTCNGMSNGSITIKAKGGVKRYQARYKIEGEQAVDQIIPFEPEAEELTIAGLKAGAYIVSLTDGNSCIGHIDMESTVKVIITQPEAIKINTATADPTGFGLSNGNITYRISGGTFIEANTPSYNVELIDSLNHIVPFTTAVDGQSLVVKAVDLPKGRYTITVKDGNFATGEQTGCSYSETHILTEPRLLTVKLNITSTVDCHGFNTGILQAVADGGHRHSNTEHQDYMYEWVKIDGQTETILTQFTTAIATDLVAGIYKVKVTDYITPANTAFAQIEIKQPPLLVTTPTLRKVSCFGGNDGFIHIAVEGGVGNYKLFCKQHGVDKAFAEYAIDADQKTFKLDRLIAGKYEIYIQDGNGCYAKLMDEDTKVIEITQPRKALEIVKMSKIEPSGFGLANGSITLSINGGTPNPDNSYNLTWKNKKGDVVLTTTQGDFIDGLFVTTLPNQPDGEYTVELRDGNYNVAFPDANTCCFVIMTYKLTEPAKLEVKIEETQVISCNGRSDGELTAHATGGYVNTNTAGLPYKYAWFKKTDTGFVVLPNEKTSVLKNRETGVYKVEIEDYSRIVNRTSEVFTLVEPQELKVTSTQQLITCGQTIDVTAFPTGGTMPYHYQWGNGESIQTLKDQVAGKFFVLVTDSRGCRAESLSKITTPSDLMVTGTYTDPICYQSATGTITLSVTGGRSPYTYKWTNGATTKDLTNIGAGYYTVVATDKDGCSYSESFILEDPEQLTVDLGKDRTLCNGQELVLTPVVKDPKTKFSWTSDNGFTSNKSSVKLTKAGNYRVTITDSKGCTAFDDINVSVTNTDISSEMVVASQVFVNDTIVIVNISNPEPDRIEWLFDKNDPIKITQEEQHFAKVIFNKTGNYSIGVRSFVGDCYQDVIKTITVVKEDDILNERFKESLIKQFYVTPNPNDGNFEAVVDLTRESAIRIRVINMWNGTIADDRTLSGQKEYRVNYSLKLVHANVYMVLLETSSGKMIFRMIAQ